MTESNSPCAHCGRGDSTTQFRMNQALGYAWGRNDRGFRNDRGGEADSWAFAHYYLTVADTTTIHGAWSTWLETSRMNNAQRRALLELCDRNGVTFDESMFTRDALGLPNSYVSGQVGSIYVGVDEYGQISS